jgi:hypothetical protein
MIVQEPSTPSGSSEGLFSRFCSNAPVVTCHYAPFVGAQLFLAELMNYTPGAGLRDQFLPRECRSARG